MRNASSLQVFVVGSFERSIGEQMFRSGVFLPFRWHVTKARHVSRWWKVARGEWVRLFKDARVHTLKESRCVSVRVELAAWNRKRPVSRPNRTENYTDENLAKPRLEISRKFLSLHAVALTVLLSIFCVCHGNIIAYRKEYFVLCNVARLRRVTRSSFFPFCRSIQSFQISITREISLV